MTVKKAKLRQTPVNPKVLVAIGMGMGYGRDMIAGVVNYARANGPWEFIGQVGPSVQASAIEQSPRYDGVIFHRMEPEAAEAVRRRGAPAVSVGGESPSPGIPHVTANSRAVAEMAFGLALACRRDLHDYARATSWGDDHGRYLLDTRVTVLGGGEITRSFLRLLTGWRTTTTVVTKHPRPIEGADEVVGSDELLDVCARTDVLVLALALTPETTGIVGADVLDALPDDAVLVNIARGEHVDTDALVAALTEGRLGGAGLDVTDPEPLPDGHPLWTAPGVLITPHTANTQAMGRPLLAARVEENVRRRAAGEDLLGPVDVSLGY